MTSDRQRRIPAPLLRVAALLAGIFIGALLLEGGARVAWRAPWYEQLVAYQRSVQTYDYKKNRWGLRDDSPTTAKPAGVKRVFMLGDSFTFGLGVPEDDLIFPNMIERALNERRFESAPNGIELMNAGEPGALSADWLRIWRLVGAEYQPDLVVVVFFLRDGTETLLIPEFFMRIREDVVQRNADSYWYRNFYTFRLVRDRLDRNKIARTYTQRFIDAYFGSESQTAEWRRAQRNLAQLRDNARQAGADFALVIYPVLVQLDEHYPFTGICDAIEDYGESIGVPVYNLLPDFLGHDASQLWVSPWDQHPNGQGHRITADALTPFLAGLLGP